VEKEQLERLLCSKVIFIKKQLWIFGVADEDLENMTSDVFEEAYKGLRKLREAEKIEGWLRTIIMRRVSKYIDEKSNRCEVSNILKDEFGEEIDLYELYTASKSAEEIFIKAQQDEEVRKLVASLPTAKRRIIQLHIWGEYTFTEIARVMKLNDNTVKTVYYRTLDQLRKEAQNER